MPSAGSASASVSAQAQDDQHIDAAVPVEPDEPALTSYPPERVYRTSSSPSSPSRTAQLNPQSAVLDHSASTSSSTSAPGWQNNGSTAGHDDEPGQDNVKQSRRSMQIFGTPQVGIIGHHKPREIVRIERDYTAGETCQFWSGFPLELEGRVGHLNTRLRCVEAHCYSLPDITGRPPQNAQRAQYNPCKCIRPLQIHLRQHSGDIHPVSVYSCP